MKAILVVAVLLQIIVAVQSEGLIRALTELSAFLLVVAIVVSSKQQKRQSLELEAEKR
ncbi:hypothetical protein [Vibrio brasiliensis]|jgi:hypothetical protein|uniref:O-succinylbenzoic acid--CoA ligase n=1 Tax=Vibrio brasiliensis LMG 20546 TaxID=945543 RepID=E8LQV2_9VIBR|nr:hypothetical protein [Vibrio brasiliensis]EGA66878.1 hypothetical protein VIBR0546_04147 [Vibrio brasiliensis LMG 20546]MCG9647223.1 hypothetical protein [Vibrio brasiliensis]MCG9725725.1 hypothetical protein [Vibrio brasiliensis]|tara:strand:+ start:787 stop:960 length:174 start_codon:yes stop_codon:yes gene_type:complete